MQANRVQEDGRGEGDREGPEPSDAAAVPAVGGPPGRRGRRSPSPGRHRGPAAAGSESRTPLPTRERDVGLTMVFSPTFDPSDVMGAPGLGQRLASFNAEVAAAVNTLTGRTEVLGGRIVGVETAHRTLADGAHSALREVLVQARAEFQAQRGLPAHRPERSAEGGGRAPPVLGG